MTSDVNEKKEKKRKERTWVDETQDKNKYKYYKNSVTYETKISQQAIYCMCPNFEQ